MIVCNISRLLSAHTSRNQQKPATVTVYFKLVLLPWSWSIVLSSVESLLTCGQNKRMRAKQWRKKKWATARQNKQNDLWVQQRLRSAWSSDQSDQSPRCPHEEILGPWLSLEPTAETLIRLGQVILLVLSCCSSNAQFSGQFTQSLHRLNDISSLGFHNYDIVRLLLNAK